MTDAQFNKVCDRALRWVKVVAPYDTGNLSRNAINGIYTNTNTYVISVDEDIAPYMPFTNEPWISKRWHGKKNPNEGWWQDATEIVARAIAAEFHGELKILSGE